MTLAAFFKRKGAPKQVDFAKALGMDVTYLSRLISGDRYAGPRWVTPIVRATKHLVRAKDIVHPDKRSYVSLPGKAR